MGHYLSGIDPKTDAGIEIHLTISELATIEDAVKKHCPEVLDKVMVVEMTIAGEEFHRSRHTIRELLQNPGSDFPIPGDVAHRIAEAIKGHEPSHERTEGLLRVIVAFLEASNGFYIE